jgi:pimeloyl-ACP methyl ester carboxylesterase
MMAEVSPEILVELASVVFPAVDAAVLATPDGPAFAEFFAAMTRAAFESGTAGLIDDMIALNRPWGFGLGDVPVPVTIWHGELDENVPVSHGRALADALSNATARIRPEHGHLSILVELPSIVADAADLVA